MYTVVLMAALTTSSSSPEFGRHGCHGCHGCSGYSACNGYTCVGYTCYGSPGCYGGCFGYNACYGYSSFGGWGHGPYTSYGGVGCTGCYGCYGGYSCYGMPFPGGATYMSPGMSNPIPPASEVTPLPRKKIDSEARAKVRVEMPEDAKLYVDGVLMKTTAAVRNFQTPSLEPNQSYYYELKAELIRNNQAFTEVQRIVVRGGEQASASFAGLEVRTAAAAVSNPATAQR